MSKKVEILAPAGDYESFLAALNSGADAVYFGIDEFNARGNIENFTVKNLKNIVQKAHLFGVKTYITLNILIKDNEFENVLSIVRECLKAKVDAFIVQDIGLASLLLKKFKGIELHASTQMGISNLAGAKFIEKLGFKRVVLSRETPLEEIKRIKQNTNLDIEYFVQGALCVGFSGNCYLCSLLAGASGNRGKCKQFCRLKYTLEGKEGYFLSTKDFCMLSELSRLVECGVTSLKIEGRARRNSYVAVSTQIYKKAVENNFNYNAKDIIDLQKVYNRGNFIPGYFGNEKIIYSKAQNHIGVPIGKVISFKKGKRFNEIEILSSHNLIKGDAIKLFDNGNEFAVLSIVDVKKMSNKKYLITSTADVKEGLDVNLIVDYALESQALNKTRKLNFDCEAIFKIGQKAQLNLRCNDVSISAFGDELVRSINSPLTKEDVMTCMSKCGEEFSLNILKCNIENVFLRKSDLNELRRKALGLLREKLIETNESKLCIHEENFNYLKPNHIKNDKKIVFFDDFKQIIDEINEKDYFVYSPNVYNLQDIINLSKKLEKINFFIDLPVIAKKEDVEFFVKLFDNAKNLGAYATNYYGLNLTDKDRTIAGSELNVFNSLSLDFYHKLGYSKIVLSKEDFEKDKLILQGEVFVDCRPPRYIYFNHCPIKEHFESSCGNCKYRDGIKYKLGTKEFELVRKKVIFCHFYLKGQTPLAFKSDLPRVIEKSHD